MLLSLKVNLTRLITSPSVGIAIGVGCLSCISILTSINTDALNSGKSERNRFPKRRLDGGTQVIASTNTRTDLSTRFSTLTEKYLS